MSADLYEGGIRKRKQLDQMNIKKRWEKRWEKKMGKKDEKKKRNQIFPTPSSRAAKPSPPLGTQQSAHLSLRRALFKNAMKQAQRETTQPRQHVRLPQPPNLPQALVPRPPIRRDLKNHFLDVNEAHSLVGRLQGVARRGQAMTPFPGEGHVSGPLCKRTVGVHAAVVASDEEVVFLRLQVASWLEGLERLLDDLLLV